jgi:hypothetical protein
VAGGAEHIESAKKRDLPDPLLRETSRCIFLDSVSKSLPIDKKFKISPPRAFTSLEIAGLDDRLSFGFAAGRYLMMIAV